MAETDFDDYVIIKFFFFPLFKVSKQRARFQFHTASDSIKVSHVLIFKTERKSKNEVSSLFLQRNTRLSLPYTYSQQIRDVDLAGNATHVLG